MTYTNEGLIIVCTQDGIIQTVHYSFINTAPIDIEGKLFIDLFVNEYISKALDFIIEIKKSSASFGWELILKPEYSDEPFYFGGALINDGITIFGSKAKVDFTNYLSGISRINEEQLNRIRTLEKEQSNSSGFDIHTSSYYFDELSRLNNDLIGMQRELFQKNAEINKANEELKKLNSLKDKFFSIIAHDLKSPFQGLVGLTQLIVDGASSFSKAELDASIKELNSSAKNLFKQLTNLLDWARMQRGTIGFGPKNINLFEILSANIELLHNRGEQKGIEIISGVSKDCFVRADEDMLNSILRNLLSNALKFTKRNGKITIISTEAENHMVEIAVKDDGIGMSPELVEKLFKIEERVGHKGTEREAGTGLGLLLCKEFVERHGGKIWVESKINSGSTFYFTIQSKLIDMKK
ncbi:MAG: HAMP domain-containing sensor histidine kinase [Ignavibacteriaceae bacterium]